MFSYVFFWLVEPCFDTYTFVFTAEGMSVRTKYQGPNAMELRISPKPGWKCHSPSRWTSNWATTAFHSNEVSWIHIILHPSFIFIYFPNNTFGPRASEERWWVPSQFKWEKKKKPDTFSVSPCTPGPNPWIWEGGHRVGHLIILLF